MSLLHMPWYAFPLIGAGVIYLSTTSFFQGEHRAADIGAAMAGSPPAAVSLNDYQRSSTRDVKFAEATILAQIVTDESTQVSRRKSAKRIFVNKYEMRVLADPSATETPHLVKGLIVVDQDDGQALEDYIRRNTVDEGPLGPIVALNGSVSFYDPSSRAKDALADRGISLEFDEYYIEPFLAGRDASLRAELEGLKGASTKFMLMGIAICMIGFLKLFAMRLLARQAHI